MQSHEYERLPTYMTKTYLTEVHSGGSKICIIFGYVKLLRHILNTNVITNISSIYFLDAVAHGRYGVLYVYE